MPGPGPGSHLLMIVPRLKKGLREGRRSPLLRISALQTLVLRKYTHGLQVHHDTCRGGLEVRGGGGEGTYRVGPHRG